MKPECPAAGLVPASVTHPGAPLSTGQFGCAEFKLIHFKVFEETKFHRIIEWFRLEGTLKNTSFQTPCHGQGHLSLDQAAQSHIQLALEHVQGVGIHSSSGQLVPVPHPCHGKKFLPYI